MKFLIGNQLVRKIFYINLIILYETSIIYVDFESNNEFNKKI